VGALELDRLTWPEVQAELDRGRDTVVVAFGATEQHGPHMPLATDALIGDHLARLVADELDAFLAPTVRLGCSEHHLAFPGTISIAEGTFAAIVADTVSSLDRGGFARAILLPTHGGNFGPLGAAVAALDSDRRIEVRALSDLSALLAIAQLGASEFDVPIPAGGLHAGEWETSMMLAIHPSLVHAERAAPGYTGDPQTAVATLFTAGVDSLAPNGVIGDPAAASAEHGERYWREVLAIALAEVG
jgi:creatinine amidohydrolase